MRTALFTMVVGLLGLVGGWAHAQQRPVEVVTVASPPPPELVVWGSLALAFERIELGGLELGLDESEIDVARNGVIPLAGPWSTPLVGSVSFGSGYRPLPWLRVPEMRIEIGGGSSDGPWLPLAGATPGLDARLTSIFFMRLELRAGVAIPLGVVEPYILARAAVGGYWVDADVRFGPLGRLGTETMLRAGGDLGFEAGLAVRIVRGVHAFGAWRESFTDARGSGVVFGVNFGLPEEQEQQ